MPGDVVVEVVDGTRDAEVEAGEGSSFCSILRRRICPSGLSLPAGLRMLCMPRDRVCLGSSGECAGVAMADAGVSPAFVGLDSRELSLIGGRVLDDSNGGRVLYLSSFLWMDEDRDTGGPCDIWTSSLEEKIPPTPLH